MSDYRSFVQSLPECPDQRNDRFETTHWSVVLAAGTDEKDPGKASRALARLCQTYWAPLYGIIRGRGAPVHDAQDLTQGFFAHLIQNRIYTRADRQKGPFRAFLLGSLKNFLADAHAREQTLKRGGGCEFLVLDEQQVASAEAVFQNRALPPTATFEDREFERQWAQALITAALTQLSDDYKIEGKGALFSDLEIFLRSSPDPLPTYDQLAVRLAMPAVTVRSHVARLRNRYRTVLRAEVRKTVDSAEAVDEELRELLRVLTTI